MRRCWPFGELFKSQNSCSRDKLGTTIFEDAAVREHVIDLYEISDNLTDSDDIMAAKINLIRDGYTRAYTERAMYTVRNAGSGYIR